MNIITIYNKLFNPKQLLKNGMILYEDQGKQYFIVMDFNNKLIALDYENRFCFNLFQYDRNLELINKRLSDIPPRFDCIYETTYKSKLFGKYKFNKEELIWERG